MKKFLAAGLLGIALLASVAALDIGDVNPVDITTLDAQTELHVVNGVAVRAATDAGLINLATGQGAYMCLPGGSNPPRHSCDSQWPPSMTCAWVGDHGPLYPQYPSGHEPPDVFWDPDEQCGENSEKQESMTVAEYTTANPSLSRER